MLPPSTDGRVRHIKTIDEKLVPRESLGPQAGKQMYIVSGRHAGMGCRVESILPVDKGRSGIQSPGTYSMWSLFDCRTLAEYPISSVVVSEKASVRLDNNEEMVVVRLSELGESVKHKSKKSKLSNKPSQPESYDGLPARSLEQTGRVSESKKVRFIL